MVLKYPNPMHTPSTEEMFRVRERLLMDAMSNSKSVSHARLIQNNLEGKFSTRDNISISTLQRLIIIYWSFCLEISN